MCWFQRVRISAKGFGNPAYETMLFLLFDEAPPSSPMGLEGLSTDPSGGQDFTRDCPQSGLYVTKLMSYSELQCEECGEVLDASFVKHILPGEYDHRRCCRHKIHHVFHYQNCQLPSSETSGTFLFAKRTLALLKGGWPAKASSSFDSQVPSNPGRV